MGKNESALYKLICYIEVPFKAVLTVHVYEYQKIISIVYFSLQIIDYVNQFLSHF